MNSLRLKNGIVLHIAVIILQIIFFILPLPINFAKINLVVLFFYTLAFAIYVKFSLYHPYTLFLGTFFLFMLSRIFLDVLGGVDFAKNNFFVYHTFSYPIQLKILQLLTFSILFIHLGALLAMKRVKKITSPTIPLQDAWTPVIKKIGLMLFYVGVIPYVLYVMTVVSFITQNGFSALYTSNTEIVTNPILKLGDDICILGFYLFLACYPSKKELKLPLFIYCVLLLFSLGIGLRGVILTQVLCLFVYFGLRGMISKKLLFASVPIIVLLSLFVGQMRTNEEIKLQKGIVKTTKDFLYDQGTSIMIVGLAIQEKENLKEVSIFSPLRHMFYNSIVARKFFNSDISGQTEEYVKISKSLGATLAYMTSKEDFLRGSGIGTAMIAEFYLSGGLFGVIIGSFFFLYLIVYFFEKYKHSVHGMFLLFFILPSFFFVPRNNPFIVVDVVMRPIVFLVFLHLFLVWINMKKQREKV